MTPDEHALLVATRTDAAEVKKRLREWETVPDLTTDPPGAIRHEDRTKLAHARIAELAGRPAPVVTIPAEQEARMVAEITRQVLAGLPAALGQLEWIGRPATP